MYWKAAVLGALLGPVILTAVWVFLKWGMPEWDGLYRLMILNAAMIGAVSAAGLAAMKEMDRE